MDSELQKLKNERVTLQDQLDDLSAMDIRPSYDISVQITAEDATLRQLQREEQDLSVRYKSVIDRAEFHTDLHAKLKGELNATIEHEKKISELSKKVKLLDQEIEIFEVRNEKQNNSFFAGLINRFWSFAQKTTLVEARDSRHSRDATNDEIVFAGMCLLSGEFCFDAGRSLRGDALSDPRCKLLFGQIKNHAMTCESKSKVNLISYLWEVPERLVSVGGFKFVDECIGAIYADVDHWGMLKKMIAVERESNQAESTHSMDP